MSETGFTSNNVFPKFDAGYVDTWEDIVRGETSVRLPFLDRDWSKTSLVFTPLRIVQFQHGFKGVKPSNMVGFQVFKDLNDSIYIFACPDGPKNYSKSRPNQVFKARTVPKLEFHEMCRNYDYSQSGPNNHSDI